MSSWDHVGHISPLELIDARLEAHHAAQWLARSTRVYSTPVADDSHTSLVWDSSTAALMTQAITPNFALGLRLHPMALVAQLPNGNESFNLFGRTEKDVGKWMSELLSAHKLDPSQLDTPGPYSLPKHPLDSGLTYGLANKESFEELGRYFANASDLLETVRRTQPTASPVRCWPHHFDIATLISLDKDGGEHARSIGVGMSPGDDIFPEPYFYISPWPYPSQADLPPMPEPAFWYREGFTAVILKSSDLTAIKDGKQQQDRITLILENAIQVNLDLLHR